MALGGLGVVIEVIGIMLGLTGCSNQNQTQQDTPGESENHTNASLKDRKEDTIPEATKEEILESIQEVEESTSEVAVYGAQVMCSSAIDPTESVLLKYQSNYIEINGGGVFTQDQVELEEKFSGCSLTKGACVESKATIQGGEWKEYRPGVFTEEGHTLDVKKSYMICSNGGGCGFLSFKDSGQEIRSKWDMLEKYINEEAIEDINSRWDIETFKKTYNEDVLVKMKKMMLEAGITEEISICAFLASIGAESWYGEKKVEERDKKDFIGKTYTYETRGAGLIQVTGLNQRDFIDWLLKSDPELKGTKMEENLMKLREGYTGSDTELNPSENSVKIYEDGEADGIGAADFLAKYYATEISIWYWAHSNWYYCEEINKGNITDEDMVPISPNDYVVKFKEQNENVDNIFLASQMFVNGSGWRNSRRHKIANEEEEDKYIVALELTEKEKVEWIENEWVKEIDGKFQLTGKGILSKSEKELGEKSVALEGKSFHLFFKDGEKSHDGSVPNGWGERYHDWVVLKKKWEEEE